MSHVSAMSRILGYLHAPQRTGFTLLLVSIQILGMVFYFFSQATLLAIREIHQKLYPGIEESKARSMMATALGAAGLKDGGCLTLFGGALTLYS